MTLYGVTLSHIMLYDAVWCCMTSYDVVWCCMMLYDVVWHRMMLYDVVWRCMMLYDQKSHKAKILSQIINSRPLQMRKRDWKAILYKKPLFCLSFCLSVCPDFVNYGQNDFHWGRRPHCGRSPPSWGRRPPKGGEAPHLEWGARSALKF